MHRYSKFSGQFICHECKIVVDNARLYYSSLDLTWFCINKHLSKVNLNVRGY